ncbi:MAG: geranylgeranyl reductase family protein [Thermoflexales bacterium]|nr:geranylgeranyl reductase family protein [Thermoflexales bacterium]
MGQDYDVIVVGAGPAGATAAFHLGAAGKRVLVLEKERLPRHKPCGGGVPTSVLRRFPIDFSPMVEREVRRVRFRFADGREVTADLPSGAVVMVRRDRFDHYLVSQAHAEVRDGARVVDVRQDGTGVEAVLASSETVRARYLILADGAGSSLARRVGLRRGRRMGVTLEAEVPANDHIRASFDAALFLFGLPIQGYAWVFPKSDRLSIGVGAFLGRPEGLRGLLEQEMARLGIPLEEARLYGHPLPVYLQHEQLHQGRVLLTGDAAGLVDPLLGEGIRHAVRSGERAAEAILREDISGYTARIHREIGNDLLWGLRWARFFYNHPRVSFEWGVRNPLFLREFLRLLAGRTTYRAMALRAPFLVALGVLCRRKPEKD